MKKKIMFKLFGWRIYITKGRMRNRSQRSHHRNTARMENLSRAGFKCQHCGTKIEKVWQCSMHSKLDATHPALERYRFENVELLCPACNREYQNRKRAEQAQLECKQN